MQWTHEQEAIFNVFQGTEVNLCINAAPGSGKTTILKELWELSQDEATLYLAFNKSIVTEASSKMRKKAYSAIHTFNGLGARLCSSVFKSKLNSNKVYFHIKDKVEHLLSEKTRERDKYSLFSLVGYCKSNLDLISLQYPRQNEEKIRDLIEFYDLEDYEGIEQHVATVLSSSNNDTKTIDFNDQLLLPVLYELEFPFYELCLVDEAQDVNNIQREMLRRLGMRNTALRYVYVGDSHQAIYSFRGALSDSLEVLSDEFICARYPLTYTYRCAKAIVERAQAIWPDDIRYLDSAAEGIVRCTNTEEREINTSFKAYARQYPVTIAEESWCQHSFILCRTMAPLVSFAYQLLRAHIPCHVKGRDIGNSFIRYIQKSNTVYVNDFLAYMTDDIEQQIAIAQRQKKDDKVLRLYDKLETLTIFCEMSGSLFMADVVSVICDLFQEGKGITLSTIHRSKGLEADKVFILAPDLMPHPLAKKSWERVQEKNIEYVAVTRAKNELVFI